MTGGARHVPPRTALLAGKGNVCLTPPDGLRHLLSNEFGQATRAGHNGSMREPQIASVHRYLSVSFPGKTVEQHLDFDRSAESFKVHIDRETVLLKVLHTWLDDHNEEEVIVLLDKMEVGQALEQTKGTDSGILVSEAGVRHFVRGT